MSEFFTEEDFIDIYPGLRAPSKIAAHKANTKLEAHIETLPVVYGTRWPGDDHVWLMSERTTGRGQGDSHTARLWNIETLGCQHESQRIWEPHLAGARKCNDCGMVKYSTNGKWEKVCEHTPVYHQGTDKHWGFHCQKCGKNIRPKGGWEAE